MQRKALKQIIRMAQTQFSDNEFQKYVIARLDKLENQAKKYPQQPVGDYLLPREVCEILKISKNKFYSLVNSGYLTTIKPVATARKTYVLRSQVVALFPKDLAN